LRKSPADETTVAVRNRPNPLCRNADRNDPDAGPPLIVPTLPTRDKPGATLAGG